MKRFRQILFWLTLVLIFALVVLCIVGAFLGAGRAKMMFNSFPMWFVWGLLAILLSVGLFAWGKMWRSPGLLAMHVGLLLILAGGLWGSKAAHEWRAENFMSDEKTPIGYLEYDVDSEINPYAARRYPVLFKPPVGYLELDVDSEINPYPARRYPSLVWNVSNEGDIEPIGRLPFSVEASGSWVVYYPQQEGSWKMWGSTLDEKTKKHNITPLLVEVGLPSLFPAVNGEVTILGFNPTLRQIELQLTRNGQTFTNSIIAGPSDSPAILSLVDVFDSREDWIKANRPMIVIQPPRQYVREYKAELIIYPADDGSEIRKTIKVNHPLHTNGYHFYLSACDPRFPLIIRVVSDDGLYWVYAGFSLLMLGVMLRLWIEPILRRTFRKEFEDVR